MKRKSSDLKIKIFNQLSDKSEILIYALDEQSNIQFVNSAFGEITGYNESEVIGRNFWELLLPSELSSQSEKLITEIENNDTGSIELLIKSKSGDLLLMFINFIRESGEGNSGNVFCYGLVQKNKTDYLQRLTEIQTELETKNEELDSFAHAVAHDLKNPLGVLLGFTDILYKEHENLTQDQLWEVLKSIKKTGFKMKSIIKELLLLSEVRKESITLESIDMQNCLNEALVRVEDMLERSGAEVIIAENIPDSLGYLSWIEEIWVNYLSNAIRYGAKPPRIEIGFDLHGKDKIKYWVKDDGKGIEVEEQKKLFVPFTRLQVVRAEGHGLGLSVVQTIVEKLNGVAGIESEPGKGSKFYFILPQK